MNKKSEQNLQDLRACLYWFERSRFSGMKLGSVSVSVGKTDLPNYFNVRVRANDRGILYDIDTAAEFYAQEIDQNIRLNFS